MAIHESLRVAFINQYSPQDTNAWSGTLFHIRKTLSEVFTHIDNFGTCKPNNKFTRFFHFSRNVFAKRRFISTYHVSRLIFFKRFYEKKLSGRNYDLLIGPAATAELSLVETSIPIIYINDSTFILRNNYYHYYRNLAASSIADSNRAEKSVLQKCSAAVFSSRWAARSAEDHYGVEPAKIHVIPFGSNIENDRFLEKTTGGTINILFVAKDWRRKRGHIVLECLEKLSENRDVSLTIVGCNPGVSHPKARVIEYLDKSKPADLELLKTLYRDAHFLLLPTEADCSPIVICEAFAFGVPVLATRTGGIPEMIDDKNNGILMSLDAMGEDYAQQVSKSFDDTSFYRKMSANAYLSYQTTFNWKRWGTEFEKVVDKVMNNA